MRDQVMSNYNRLLRPDNSNTFSALDPKLDYELVVLIVCPDAGDVT
jgi:hypothetical protein